MTRFFNFKILLPLITNVINPLWRGCPSPIPLAKELTHDKQYQAEDEEDKLRGITPRAGTLAAIGLEMKRFMEPGVLEHVKVPWLLLSSPDDTLISPASADALESRSSTPKELRSRHDFPGLWHELLRETPKEREKVLNVLLDWMATRISQAPRSRL